MPTREQLEQQAGVQTEFPENNYPLDWDTRAPDPGKIRLYAEITLQEAVTKIEAALAEVPDGVEGDDSVLYGKLTQWLQQANQQLLTKTRTGLLDLGPAQAEVYAEVGKVAQHELLKGSVAHMHNVSKALIYNMADFIDENPAPTVAQQNKMIPLFCRTRFIDYSDWDGEPLPFDSRAVFIMNPENAAAALQTKTLEEIQNFLIGREGNDYFERYEPAGDGIPVLKVKYAAEKAAIQAKLAEVLAYAAQLEAQE